MPAREDSKTPPKTLTPRQSQIVDAGLRIIATKGTRRFTADLLAKEVGLTGGALYRHFTGMEGVVDAIVARVGQILFQDFPPEAEDPIERLRLFFFRRARTILEHPHISRLLLSDHLAQAAGSAQSKRLDAFKQKSRAFVIDCLKEAKNAGFGGDGMDPEAGAVVVTGTILALSHATPRLARKRDGDRLFDEVWAGIERMIRCEGHATKPVPGRKVPRRMAGS
jgi:AcrR family transcriptional regulator